MLIFWFHKSIMIREVINLGETEQKEHKNFELFLYT